MLRNALLWTVLPLPPETCDQAAHNDPDANVRLSAKTDIFLQAAPGTPPVSQEAGTPWMSMGNFGNLHSLEDSEVITTMQDQIMLASAFCCLSMLH